MKAGRREEGPSPWQEAPRLPGEAANDNLSPVELHGARGRITYAAALTILARHYQVARASTVPGHIDVLRQLVGRPGQRERAWQTIPLTLGALRNWLGY